jgi:predicted DCC family thiol-disulfide oxidoreductase YuxK
MISLITEITDTKGMRATRGFIFFDRDCSVCTSLARRFRDTLAKRGFGLAALQDPRAAALLNLPSAELLREMRVATVEGKVFGGAAAVMYLARRIWWAWPLYAVARLPGATHLLDACYRRFASRRGCLSGSCSISGGEGHTL